MNRTEWEFPYTADKLLAAAERKKSFHEGRLGFWETKRKEVEATIRSEGIEIDESVAARAGSADNNLNTLNYSGRGAQVTIRNDLVKDLHECVTKVSEHRGKVKEYDAWVQVLASQGAATFDLHQDDWLFFFGK